MTILSCSATSCIYNKEELCSKGDILVDGPNAHTPNETCCASFQKRTQSSATNSCASGCGCETIQIDCKACECTYNEQHKCTASAIDISGSGASKQDDTMCSTFQEKM